MLCCQNLLAAIPRCPELGSWSSPALLFFCFLSQWARPPTTPFLKLNTQESSLLLLSPHISSDASFHPFHLLRIHGIHTLLFLPAASPWPQPLSSSGSLLSLPASPSCSSSAPSSPFSTLKLGGALENADLRLWTLPLHHHLSPLKPLRASLLPESLVTTPRGPAQSTLLLICGPHT